MGWLDNQVALITGGGFGLGAAIARRFVAEGARVALFDKSRERAKEVADSLGEKAIAITGDVRKLDDNFEAVAQTVKAFGKLDCFIGNAGVWDLNAHLVDYARDKLEAAYEELFGVNFKGYLFGAKAAMPELVKTKGCVIFTISDAGYLTDNGGTLYTTSKHALMGLTKQLAFEFAPHIRVNGVAPGFIPTDIRGLNATGEGERSIAELSDMVNEVLPEHLPVGTVPKTEDYTGIYVLFASRANSGMATGAVFNIDGGMGIRGNMTGAGGKDLPERIAGKKKESLY